MSQELSGAEKRKLLNKVIDGINKDAGETAIGFATDVAKPLRFIPTPSEELNLMLGGGFPIGRITEIFGNNSSGKTSVTIETIGEDMAAYPDNFWGWIESEESFDPDYARDVHGVDLDRLIYIDITDEGSEKALDRLESLMRTGVLRGFVVNSVAGLSPKAEMDEAIGKQSIALQARMMSKLMRKWTTLIGKRDIVALFINQQRTDIAARFGDPNVTTGGRALSYYASLRFGMNRLMLQDSDPITKEDGLKIGARVAKNRCVYDNPYKKCEYYVIYGVGVDKLYEVMENAPDAGILRKSGSWFYYEEEDGELIIAEKATIDGVEVKDHPMKFQGKAKLRAFLTENEWFANQLTDELRGKAARGELMPKFQTDEEMKEIERLEKLDKELAKEFEKETKAPAKAKRTKELERGAEDEDKPKTAPARKKKAVPKDDEKVAVAQA